jgi:cation diffusion facilitator family transporter
MNNSSSPSLTRYAWLSIAAAVSTILLKGVAWQLTGSVGLLSDAIESFVNLAGALMALWMLTLAAQPADAAHPHGHGKAEYFSSAFEGFLIVLAAFSIGYAAVMRLLEPQPLEAVGVGLVVSVIASIINFATAGVLMRVGKKHNSITLEADAHHLMTDVWTSAGVIAGVGLVAWSGWLWLDPVIALLVAANIVWTGYQLMRRSADGLMDHALPAEKLEKIERLLASYREKGLEFHACARGRPAAEPLSPCTYWFPATGPSGKATTGPDASRPISGKRSNTPTSRPTSNRSATRSRRKARTPPRRAQERPLRQHQRLSWRPRPVLWACAGDGCAMPVSFPDALRRPVRRLADFPHHRQPRWFARPQRA